jgi:signal transduction histidine kinase
VRRRAIQMTTAAVAVAVALLGIPGLILGSLLIWRDAEVGAEGRATSVATMVEQRLDAGNEISMPSLERYANAQGQYAAHIIVLTPFSRIEAGKPIDGRTISFTKSAGTDATVTVAISRDAVVRSVALFGFAGLILISFSFTVGVAFALHQSRRLSAPLIYLAAAAEQVGAGQTRPQMEKTGIEEIDLVYEELVRTADRMAGRISAERQFAADASHQLRTPLTALSMRLEEIEYLTDDPEVKKEANACLEQVERLTGVVQDLLANSRSAASGSTEAVRLKLIFAQQKEEWEMSFTKRGRELVFDTGGAPAVLANPASLSQILATLIENSLKYGAGTTSVRAKKAGHGVVIDVTDEGPGVDPDLTEAIFRKGVSTGGSTGIGLPLARSLAENVGGRLELTQNKPPVFSLALSALPQSLDPDRILPAGSIITVGSRRRRR